jgi:DNA-binding NtrC family response regulator
MTTSILIVDDEQIIRESLSFILKKEGYKVEEAGDGEEALAKHNIQPYDIVVTDIEMPEIKGVELLKRIRQQTPQTLVVLITAFGSIETAIQALREGAADYILKPVNFDDFLCRIKRLSEYHSLITENTLLRQELQRTYDFAQIVGKSDSMKKVFDIINRVSNILLRGPFTITAKGVTKDLFQLIVVQ